MRTLLTWSSFLVLGASCTADLPTASYTCINEAPETVVIKRLDCDSEKIVGGEGVVGDWYVAAPTYRAVLRNPVASLTVAGLRGGTLIDAAPWGRADRIHEVIPLADGHWLDTQEVFVDGNTLTLRGPARVWPNRTYGSSPTDLEVSWTFSNTAPHIQIFGHDDVWVHGKGTLENHADRWISPNLTVYLNGDATEDRGGAVLHHNATSITIRDHADPIDDDMDASTRVSGQAIGASSLEFWNGERLLTRLHLDSDTFDTAVPKGTTKVRAIGPNKTLSRFADVNPTLELVLVDSRDVTLEFQWADARTFPVGIHWSESQNRQVTTLPPDGGTLTLPGTVTDIHVGVLPRLTPQHIDVSNTETDEPLVVLLDASAFPDHQKWITLDGPHDRSKQWRGTSSAAMNQLIAEGFEWAVAAPEFDVGLLETDPETMPPYPWRAGSQSAHPNGWSILSWPWIDKSKLSGRGVPPVTGLNAMEALASITAGPSARRFTAASSLWFSELETLDGTTNQEHPDFIWVDSAMDSSNPIASLDAWFQHLNAQRFIPPVGSRNWAPVLDPSTWSGADIEASLLHGHAVASNGPLLQLNINDIQPGGTVTEKRRELPGWVQVDIDIDGPPPEQLWIISDGVAKKLDVSAPTTTYSFKMRPAQHWMLALGWSPDAGPWAITGPIWFERGEEPQ